MLRYIANRLNLRVAFKNMKFVIFAGTPGSGKTSIIKYIIQELKDDFKLFLDFTGSQYISMFLISSPFLIFSLMSNP